MFQKLNSIEKNHLAFTFLFIKIILGLNLFNFFLIFNPGYKITIFLKSYSMSLIKMINLKRIDRYFDFG